MKILLGHVQFEPAMSQVIRDLNKRHDIRRILKKNLVLTIQIFSAQCMPDIALAKNILRLILKKPLIQCEYGHSMGNSMGGF